MRNKKNYIKRFYRYYLKEHSNRICRRFHFIGSLWAIVAFNYALFSHSYLFFLWAVVGGYLFAWIGHFVFEKNTPATFRYPFLSFVCDWLMFKDMCIGRITF